MKEGEFLDLIAAIADAWFGGRVVIEKNGTLWRASFGQDPASCIVESGTLFGLIKKAIERMETP